jgi:hypothetical protein
LCRGKEQYFHLFWIETLRRRCKEQNSCLFRIETLYRINIPSTNPSTNPNNIPNTKLSDTPDQTFACNLIRQTAVSSSFLYIFVSYFNRISNGK